MLLQINMERWIYQNNITWQYAYANTIDTLKAQQEIENSIKQEENSIKLEEKLEKEKLEEEKQADLEQEKLEEEDRKKKPLDKIKRRELFAKRAEERQKYKKRKSI
jgi:hypothetical protein